MLVSSLLLAPLVGCGHQNAAPSEHESPARTSPPPAPAPDTRPVIAAFGDSLTRGHGAPVGDSYPDFLQQELDRRGFAYHVVNLGISGNTTTDGLERIASVIALKPAIVILELGGNDGLRGIPVADSRANLEKMIIELRQAQIKVVLAGMSLPPNYGPDYIQRFQAMYSSLARRFHLTLIPFLLQGIAARPNDFQKLMQADGIHPTAAGNRIVAGTVLHYLQPLLRRPPAAASGAVRSKALLHSVPQSGSTR